MPASPATPTASTSIRAAAAGNFCEDDEPELIGDLVVGDAGFPETGRASNRVELAPAGGRGESYTMYYLRGGLKHPWGFYADKPGCCPHPMRNYWDTDGDLQPDGGYCIPNGVYTVYFEEVHWSPGGVVVSVDTLFRRSIAMLDTLGSPENNPSSGVFQDVHVQFSIDTLPTDIAGGLWGRATYGEIRSPGDVGTFEAAPHLFEIRMGDSLWFGSTYSAVSADTACAWCKQNQAGVLVAVNQNYGALQGAFGPATNGLGVTTSFMPMLHTFLLPSAQAYEVAARVTEPYQSGLDSLGMGRVQSHRFFVKVSGPLDASFAASDSSPVVGQQITFDGSGSCCGTLQYRWSFGDGGTVDWSGSASAQHGYSAAGAFTARLWVRRVGTSAPTDSASLQLVVTIPPLGVQIEGTDLITASGTYDWESLASGGVPRYHYQWFYRRGASEQSVGSDTSAYSRYVALESRSYVFRLRSLVTDSVGHQAQAVLFVDVMAGGKGGGLAAGATRASVGLEDARGVCVALPLDRAARQAAHQAVFAAGRWPVPCFTRQ